MCIGTDIPYSFTAHNGGTKTNTGMPQHAEQPGQKIDGAFDPRTKLNKGNDIANDLARLGAGVLNQH